MEFVLILDRLGILELQWKSVRNEGDKLTVDGLPFGVTHGVAKEALQGVQVSPVPGHLDGVADGPFYPAGNGLEGFGHLGVEDFGYGVLLVFPPQGISQRYDTVKHGTEVPCLCTYSFTTSRQKTSSQFSNFGRSFTSTTL